MRNCKVMTGLRFGRPGDIVEVNGVILLNLVIRRTLIFHQAASIMPTIRRSGQHKVDVDLGIHFNRQPVQQRWPINPLLDRRCRGLDQQRLAADRG